MKKIRSSFYHGIHGTHGRQSISVCSVYSVVFYVSVFFIVMMFGGLAHAGEEALKNASAVAANKEIVVFATIPPVAGLVEQVGGPLVRVSVLAEKGQDPHTFEATPRQIAMLGKANLYFIVGLPLEKRLQEKIQSTNPNLLVVDTTEGIEKRFMARHYHDEQGVGGRHGAEEPGAGAGSGSPAPGPRPPTPESGAGAGSGSPAPGPRPPTPESGAGAGAAPAQLPAANPSAKSAAPSPRGEPDPHVWLSPPLLQAQSRRIAEALAKVDPGHARDYARNQRALSEKLDSLDARIKKRLEPYRGRAFYVYHPAFGYFADRYGLRQEVVEVDGKSPAPRQLADYIRRAKADGVKTVFIQPQFDPKNAAAIAQSIGGKVETLDDLARDVVANLEDIAAKIEAALKNEYAGSLLSKTFPRRGKIRIAVGETHGRRPPLFPPDPEGVEHPNPFGSTPCGVGRLFQPVPWVSPTAIHIGLLSESLVCG